MIHAERDWFYKVVRKVPLVGVLLLLVSMVSLLMDQPRDVILLVVTGMMISPVIIWLILICWKEW
jgi:hypothetical protein